MQLIPCCLDDESLSVGQLGIAAGGVGATKRESVDAEASVDHQNRDFYKCQDVRPPYTYAALIRQVRQVDVVQFLYIWTRLTTKHTALY